MDIKDLTALICEHAPKAIQVHVISTVRFSTFLTRQYLLSTTQEHGIKNIFGSQSCD